MTSLTQRLIVLFFLDSTFTSCGLMLHACEPLPGSARECKGRSIAGLVFFDPGGLASVIVALDVVNDPALL